MTANGAVCIPNIGAAGIARRRRRGWTWVAGAAVAGVGLLALQWAPAWHFVLLPIYGRGLLGILQARERT